MFCKRTVEPSTVPLRRAMFQNTILSFLYFVYDHRYGATKCGLRQLQGSLLRGVQGEQSRRSHCFTWNGPYRAPSEVAIMLNPLLLCVLSARSVKCFKCTFFAFFASLLYPSFFLTSLDFFQFSGATVANKQLFNIICEHPETVARALVPKMRAVKGTGKPVNFLTPPRIILALLTAWVRRGRWFDEEVTFAS